MLISKNATDTWKPGDVPGGYLRRPDNIVSSEYSYNNYNKNVKYFSGKYHKKEKEDSVNMFQLLSMEYGRMWRKETEQTWNKTVLTSVESNFLVRRYVIRGLLMKKKGWEEQKYFKMKRFENVPSRIDNRKSSEPELQKKNFTESDIRDILAAAIAPIENNNNKKRREKILQINV